MVYLDYAATTPILDEVREAMLPYLTKFFGNPSSVHASGRAAKKGVEEAREKVAAAIGAQPSEIVFTAGGTEADNMALKGAVMKFAGERPHVLTVSTEHHAVLHSAEWLSKQGFAVTVLGVKSNGLLDLSELSAALLPETALVSVMLANNEIGTIQPIAEIVEIVHSRSRAMVHTDAVQGLGKIPVDGKQLGVDLASFSAHKLGGPKGVGALYVKRGARIGPILHGGGQERDMRSGTPNVAGIVGFGVAAEAAATAVDAEGLRLGALRDRLQEGIVDSIERVHVTAADSPRIPQTLNICIEGVEGESLLLLLDQQGIEASSGSACTSGSLDPSHVLVALGLPRQLALGSLRLSLGPGTGEEDVEKALKVLPAAVERLRSIPAAMSSRTEEAVSRA